MFYMLHGVFDRSAGLAKKVTVSWPDTIETLFSRLSGIKATSKTGHWCGLFAECDESHSKLDSLSVRTVTALVFDIDECNGASFADVIACFDTIEAGYFAWETWRSRPGSTRARVVFPLAMPIPISQVKYEWESVAGRLPSVVIHRGKGAPTEGLVIDQTSCEPSRLHVLPLHGTTTHINPAPLYAPAATGVLVTPQAGAMGIPVELGALTTKVVSSTDTNDLDNVDIEWEADPLIATPVREVTPEHIILYARASEPGKARCRCPHVDSVVSSGSYSAWARFARGVLYISCTSASHNHSAGHTWAVKQGLSTGEFVYPMPYMRSATHALIAVNPEEPGTTKAGKKKRTDAGNDKNRVVSFTCPHVSKLYQDGETKDEWWKLEWAHITHHVTQSVVLRRDIIGTASKLQEAAGRLGLDINESNKKELTRFLSEFVSYNRARLPNQLTAARMGWFDNSFLLGHTWIAGDEGSVMRELVANPSDGATKLSRAYAATGTLAGWASGFHKILSYPFAVVGIMAAVASPLLGRVGCQSFAFEWASPTGTGKTTSMRMAESVFGKPIDCEASWDNTKVSFERKAGFLCNLPMFLDDTKTSDQQGDRLAQALEWAIYRAVSGEGRGRGKPGGMDITASWNLILFSTGEEPIYGLGQAGGARARLISIQAPPFNAVTDGEVSRIVSAPADAMSANHGTLGPAVIQLMSQIPADVLRQAWQRTRDRWLTYLSGQHSAADRVSSHIALIEVAGKLMKKALSDNALDHTDFDPAGVCLLLADAMVDLDKQTGITDPVLRSFANFYTWALSHRHSFWSVDAQGRQGSGPTNGWLGRWDGGDNWSEVYFSNTALQRFLSDTRYPGSPTTLAASWLQRGLLTKNGTGNKWTVRLSGGIDHMYRADKNILMGVHPTDVVTGAVEVDNVMVLDV